MKTKLTSLLILILLTGCAPVKESSDWSESSSRSKSEAASEQVVSSEAVNEESTASSIVDEQNDNTTPQPTVNNLPSVDALPIEEEYIELNGNVPMFSNEELAQTEPYTYYSPFDSLGRTQMAMALLDVTLMPDVNRKDTKSISSIYPTGWDQGSYDFINSGGWLYNRSHLIGYQLVGNNSPENLMTGTREFNADLMLPFENFIASYVETTENPVLFRVTPIYDGNDLLAYGLQMEGYSTVDDGKDVQFNIFVPNQQEGVELNYHTGSHKAE